MEFYTILMGAIFLNGGIVSNNGMVSHTYQRMAQNNDRDLYRRKDG